MTYRKAELELVFGVGVALDSGAFAVVSFPFCVPTGGGSSEVLDGFGQGGPKRVWEGIHATD